MTTGPPAHCTPDDAERWAARHYGLTVGARALPSYIDQNFLLRTEAGTRYVLKLAHAETDPAALAFQQAALTHLSTRALAFSTPHVQSSVSGETLIDVTGPDGINRKMWMVSFLPGTCMADVSPHTPAFLHTLGRSFGDLDNALASFEHPAMHRTLLWDLKRYGQLPGYFEAIETPEQRALVAYHFRRFEETTAPLLSRLPQSVIHNDGNDHNVLVDETGDAVTGIIDFGDVVHTYTVCEPAITAAYALLGKDDVLATAAHVVAGYHERNALTVPEAEALFGLICMRLCTSVCMSAWQGRHAPENTYLAVSKAPAWDALERLASMKPSIAHDVFRQACGVMKA